MFDNRVHPDKMLLENIDYEPIVNEPEILSRKKYLEEAKIRSSNLSKRQTINKTPASYLLEKSKIKTRSVKVSAADSLALIDLYNATDGDNWNNNTNWLSNAPIEDWYGVALWGEDRVMALELSENNLSGQIPASFINLTSIVVY